jgi:hypothetical protein
MWSLLVFHFSLALGRWVSLRDSPRPRRNVLSRITFRHYTPSSTREKALAVAAFFHDGS